MLRLREATQMRGIHHLHLLREGVTNFHHLLLLLLRGETAEDIITGTETVDHLEIIAIVKEMNAMKDGEIVIITETVDRLEIIAIERKGDLLGVLDQEKEKGDTKTMKIESKTTTIIITITKTIDQILLPLLLHRNHKLRTKI